MSVIDYLKNRNETKEHFKIIHWKNKKVYNKKKIYFVIGAELLATVIIFILIGSTAKYFPNKNYDEKLIFYGNERFRYSDHNNEASKIAFVLPENKYITSENFTSSVITLLNNDSNYEKSLEFEAYDYIDKEWSSMIFQKESEVEDYMSENRDNNIFAAIIFNDNTLSNYSIRTYMDYTCDPREDAIENYYEHRRKIDDDNPNKERICEAEYKYAFVRLQKIVDNVIIKTKTNGQTNGNVYITSNYLAAPKIDYISKNNEKDEFINAIISSFPKFIPLMFILRAIHFSNRLMEDKESKIKEGLLSIGTSPCTLWTTWIVIYLPTAIFLAFLISMVTVYKQAEYITFMKAVLISLPYTVILTLYVITLFEIMVIISCLVKKNKTVNVVICLLIFIYLESITYIYKLYANGYAIIEKIISCLFSPIGVGMNFYILYEDVLKNGQIENDKTYHSEDVYFTKKFQTKININQPEFYIHAVFLVVDIILYFFIIEAIFSKDGSFKMFSFFKPHKSSKSNDDGQYSKDIEKDPTGSECLVEVKNIYKYFKSKSSRDESNRNNKEKYFAANDNISFKAYENEIFAILGQNGAGKSTLVQNMVGIGYPDGGEIYYSGMAFSKNKNQIHRQFGVCFQYNILLKGFTVEEQFKVFAAIKGIKDLDMDETLKEYGLIDKKTYNVEHLSGGQKRKLNIGLALLGNPKYVFLDEPTTGLDPLSRRNIWNLLLKNKKDRTIFITTHYMDEADIIADRKLILSKGKIRCLGSSVFLKTHFQMKYQLEVETTDRSFVESIIKQHIPEAEYYHDKTIVVPDNENTDSLDGSCYNLITNNSERNDTVISINNKVTPEEEPVSCYIWKLPSQSISKFSSLLKDLESHKGQQLSGYSINAPLLEELFISLDRENDKQSSEVKGIHLPNTESLKPLSNLTVAIRLLRYRLKSYLRSKRYLIMALIVPFVISFIFFRKYNQQISEETKKDINDIKKGHYDIKERELTWDMYKDQIMNYESIDDYDKYFKKVEEEQENRERNEFDDFDGETYLKKLNRRQDNSTVGDKDTDMNISHDNIDDDFENDEHVNDLEKKERNNTGLIIPLESYKRKIPNMTNDPASVLFPKCLNVSQEPYYAVSIYQNELYYDILDNGRDKLYDKYRVFHLTYNFSMPHIQPSTINFISNLVLEQYGIQEPIHVYNKPFENLFITELTAVQIFSSNIIPFIITVGLSFALSFYGTTVIHERKRNLLKQLQLNGISNKSYWLSIFMADYICFTLTFIVIVLSIVLSGFLPLFSFKVILMAYILFMICSAVCLLCQYVLSFLFNNDSSSYIIFIVLNIVPTLIVIFYYFTITPIGGDEDFSRSNGSLYLYFDILFGTLIPIVNICMTFQKLIVFGFENAGYSVSFGEIFNEKYQISHYFLATGISLIFYGFLFYLSIRNKFKNRVGKDMYKMTDEIKEKFEKEMEEADEDVRKEYQKVKEDIDNGGHSIPIKYFQLTKEYNRLSNIMEVHKAFKRTTYKYGDYHMSEFFDKRIVMQPFKNISIGVDRCECFGLLGPNGSGKSSILNTASFSIEQNLGKIYYNGKDTLERTGNEITLGYCPQEDTLWEQMTLYEHIEMFLYIRGYSLSKAKKLANQIIDYCQLNIHKNKVPDELSGGTRRKLNIIIALCCSSTLLLLDEPTAGMDPSTRHYVWDIIKSSIQCNHSSTVMTTHSMEEAELLCNRIGIIVNGKLHCIGSPAHLKMKFGNTYILDVYTDDIEKFHEEVVVRRDLFGGRSYEREDKSLQRVKYEVTMMDNLGSIFDTMELCRSENLYKDYSYSQTSLEQVFLNFAKLKEKQD